MAKKKPIPTLRHISQIIPLVEAEKPEAGKICSVHLLPLGAVIRRHGGILATIIFRNQSRVRLAEFRPHVIRPRDDEDQVINVRKEYDISPDAEVYLEAMDSKDVKAAPPVERPEKPEKKDYLAEAIAKRKIEAPRPKAEKVSIPRNDPPDLLPTTQLEELWGLGEKYLGEKKEELKKKYAHLDRGRQSMTLRNRIRGAWKKQG